MNKTLFKNTVGVLSLLFLLLCFPSCMGTEKKEEKEDVRFYNVAEGVLYSYSVKGGYCVPVCPDPLCKHDSEDCKFYGVTDSNPLYFEKGKLYFPKFTKDTSMICVYDEKTNELSTLFKEKIKKESLKGPWLPHIGNMSHFVLVEDYLIFNLQNDETVTEEGTVPLYDLYRVNKTTGEAFQMNREPLEAPKVCRGISKDKQSLVWNTEAGKTYFTDLNYENYRENDALDGYDLIFKQENEQFTYQFGIFKDTVEIEGEEKPVSRTALNLIAISKNTGEKKVILEDLSKWTAAVALPGNKILTSINNEKPRYIGKIKISETEEQSVYDWSSNELFLMDGDGSNKKSLGKVPEEYMMCNLSSAKKYMFSYPYIGIKTQKYNVDEHGYVNGFVSQKDIVILNIETGEWILTKSK